MPVTLKPCPGCDRHIMASESACPFCGAATPAGFGAPPAPKGPAPLSRAAILFASVAAATAATACSSSTSGGSQAHDSGTVTDSGDTDSEPVAAYGPATIDSGPMDSGQMDSEPVAAYGPGPIFDSGVADSGADAQDSEPVAAYGPGPIFDSGKEE